MFLQEQYLKKHNKFQITTKKGRIHDLVLIIFDFKMSEERTNVCVCMRKGDYY
jgi:hypothetical protein